jgi:hypothetical protein
MFISDGISLTKFWFSVSPSEQHTRFAILLIKFDHDDKDHELVGGPDPLSLPPDAASTRPRRYLRFASHFE